MTTSFHGRGGARPFGDSIPAVELVTDDSAMAPDSGPGVANFLDIPVWDRARALKRVRGRRDRLSYLVDAFLRDIAEVSARLQQMIERGCMDEVGRIAHAINGVVGNLSGMRVRVIVSEMELAARVSDAVRVQRLWPVFTQQLQLLQQQLQCQRCPEPIDLLRRAGDHSELALLLQQLMEKLQRCEYTDAGEVQALLPHIDAGAAQQAVEQLLQEPCRFDFDAAVGSINAIADMHRINLAFTDD